MAENKFNYFEVTTSYVVKAKNKNLGVKMINDLIVTSRGIVGGLSGAGRIRHF